jgi:ribosomal protein L37AE/L43A
LEAQDDLFDEAHDLFDDALCPFCGSGHITSAKENVYHCDNCGKWYEYEYE